MEKLTQFYTVWENLGSSLIYDMKSDREVFVDKSLEEKTFSKNNVKYTNYRNNN